jgi:hypothetical protein
MTDFEAWLQKGLGRAAMILKKHDSRYNRGPLLHACTHNLTYDPQCEDGRAPYLLDLIKVSSEPDFYRHCVLTALLSHDEDEDLGQLYELVPCPIAGFGCEEIPIVLMSVCPTHHIDARSPAKHLAHT